MEQTQNRQTVLFVIAVVLSLGIGYAIGYQTGYTKGGDAMHTMMHDEGTQSAGAMDHSMMEGMNHGGSMESTSVGDAMKSIESAQ